MVKIVDPTTAIISGLTIICCIFACRNYWRVKNSDAFMWVIVTFFWCVGALSKSMEI